MSLLNQQKSGWLILIALFLACSSIVVSDLNAQVATIGTGTDTNATTGAAPINIWYKSIRTQTVYTMAELNAAGMIGPSTITDLAFYIESSPLYALPNFRIRMRHTTATNASAHIDGPYEEVYLVATYAPVAGGWDLLTLSLPFEWNGVDNILIDTAFDLLDSYDQSGQQRIFVSPDGMRYTRSDSSNQWDVPTTTIVDYKPQVQLHFTPAGLYDDDMAAYAISGPPNLSPGTEGTFTISVRNMGTNSQDNYTIRLMRDGDIELDSVVGTLSLEQFETATYDLNWTPTVADEGNVTLWGEVVLAGDENPDNDTTPAMSLLVAESFSGTYTINSDGTGDFETLGEAVNGMALVGVDGPTVFEIAPGTYNEQIEIEDIMGTSEINTITFIGTGNDPDDVIISYSPSDSNNRQIIKLTGAKHLRFSNLSLQIGTDATYGYPLHIMSYSEDIEISNCHIVTIDDSSSSNFLGIVVSGSDSSYSSGSTGVSNIRIEDSTIVGGYYNIGFRGSSSTNTVNGIEVINNELLEGYYGGIYSYYTYTPLYKSNVIDLRSEGTTTTNSRGIYLYYTYGPFEFSHNRIYNPGQYGMYIYNTNNAETEPSLIYNNSIGGGFTNTGTAASGIYISSSSNIGVYFNSINNDSQSGRGISTFSSADNLSIMNNSFAFTGSGDGYAVYHSDPSSLIANDYNDYHPGTSSNFVYYGSAISNLTALQNVNQPAGNDLNSLAEDPQYVGPFDLDILDTSPLIFAGYPVPGIETDINGNPRNPTSPSIGAYEIDLDGYGSLNGYVYDTAGDEPLSGVSVFIEDTNYNVLTDDNGFFEMPYVYNGTYDVTASLFGYHEQIIEGVVIVEDETTSITFNLIQLTNITVSGQVVGSDYPTIGLADAVVNLTGYENYYTETDAGGFFSIPGVYIEQTYNLSIIAEGYTPYQDEVQVGNNNLDLGVIIVDEIAYPPHSVIATQSTDESQVDLIWNSPLAIDYYFYDFEDGDQDWTSGAISGADHWELGTPAQTNINTAYSGDNAWMIRLTQNYDNNADTWLMSPELNLSGYQEVYFSVYLNIWTENNYDGMILESSTDGGNTWTHVRSDDTALEFYNNSSTYGPMDPPKWSGQVTGEWNEYSTWIPELAGEDSVYLRFRFASDGSVQYEGIAVDDVYIGTDPPERLITASKYRTPDAITQISLNNSQSNLRLLENYNVYRLNEDDLENEDDWLFLATVTDTTYTDLTWPDAPSGYYYYAVKGVYTNDVLSEPAISNMVERDVFVTVSGQVVGSDFPAIGLENALVSLTGEHNYQVETDQNGYFTIPLVYIYNTYTLTIDAEGYATYSEQLEVLNESIDLGTIVVNETAYPPHTLVATQAQDESQVDLIWNSPLAIDYYFYDFEDGDQDWTSGAISGTDHWELGTPNQAQINSAHSGENAWMTRLNQNYTHSANTWLMSPELNLSSYNEVHFSAFLNIWCEANFDAMILESSIDGGSTWQHVRADDTDLEFYNHAGTLGPIPPPKWSGRTAGTHGIWMEFATELPELAHEPSVYLRFRFGTDGSVDGEGIAVDDVYIGPQPAERVVNLAQTRLQNNELSSSTPINVNRQSLRDNIRVLESYNIYRFLEEDMENEDNWLFLNTVNDTTYIDLTWPDAPSGYYHYAVKGVYTNDVLSEPAISNRVDRDVFVTITGQVVGSDYPSIGLEDALVNLSGVNDYTVETDEDGHFTIYLVYIFNTYDLRIDAEGYTSYQDELVVGDNDIDLGVIVLDEVAYPPHNVIATQSPDDTYVDLIWNTPLPVTYYFSDFEDDDGGWEPSADWDTIGDWEWSNEYDVNDWVNTGSTSATPPPYAQSGTGMWGTVMFTNHTNSGGSSFLSQTFDFTTFNDATLAFWSWNDSFGNWDYGQIWVNDVLVWGPEWDYTGTTWQEVIIDLSAWDGESEVEIVFEHYATTTVNYAGWYIDDIYIGPEPPERTIRTVSNNQIRSNQYNRSRQLLFSNRFNRNNERLIEGYVVYRFLHEDLGNEDNWLELATVADTTYTDLSWDTVATGFYRYAVKAEYTNDVLSEPAVSNYVGKNMTTNVTVNVTTDTGDLATGAEVKLYYLEEDPDGNSPVYTQYAVEDEGTVSAQFFNVLRGLYDLEVSYPGYETYTQSGVDIQTYTEFNVEISEIPYPPVNLRYNAASEIVNLIWDPPVFATREAELDEIIAEYEGFLARGLISKEEASEGIEEAMNSREHNSRNRSHSRRTSRALLGYNVYRDGDQINTELITSTNYSDTDVIDNETYVYYVTAVYTLAESEPSNSVTVVPGPQQVVIIGEDTTTANTLPLNFFYNNSMSQTIYMPTEINAAGLISEIQYFTSFTQTLENMPVKIWIGETEQNDLSAGWIPAGELQLVYDNFMTFPEGEHTIVFDLDEFYLYTGDSNLVIMANRPMDTQYYSSSNHFYYSVTPDHPDRSRNVQADGTEYDPYEPPTTGSLTNRVPNTGLSIISGGLGMLEGHVYYENGDPVEGATVTVDNTPFSVETDSQGYYFFPVVFEGPQTVIASKFGYYDDVVEDLMIIENQLVTQDFTLYQLPNVNVSGRVVGSDNPNIGLDEALIILEGYDYYETNGDEDGYFTIPGVYADHTYTMTVQRSGYAILTQQVDVGDTDLDLGDVIVNELAFPPFEVNAEITPDNTAAIINWISPDAYDLVEFRYDDGVPTMAIGINEGTNNTILGAAHHRSAILSSVSWYLSGATTHNTVNLFIFGLNNQGTPNSNVVLYHEENVPNTHQQWTTYELPEDIEAPNGFLIGLSVTGNLGLAADDGVGDPYQFQNNTHFYTSNYTTGNWSTMESSGYTNNFLLRAYGFDLGPARAGEPLQAPGRIGLQSGYGELELTVTKLQNRNTTKPELQLRPAKTPIRTNRVLEGFIIYRLEEGEEQNPNVWTEIGMVTSENTTFTDTGLSELLNGFYRYAVRSVYTNNVMSVASLSNTIEYEENIQDITNLQSEVIEGNVHLSWEWVRSLAMTRQPEVKTESRTESDSRILDRAFLGFQITRNGPVIEEGWMDTTYIDENLNPGQYFYTIIGIFTNGDTNMLETMAVVPVDVGDEVTVEPVVTELLGNYPNPFNPDTTIRYSLKNDTRVRIEIFNIRGQMVRTLTDSYQTAGHYSVVWDGRDDNGNDAGTGIFFYRMKSGKYTSTRKMIMMK